jgi:penicillin-binding protein 1A
MKVFAWNSRRETDTVMSPLDSIKYNHQMMQTAFLAMDPMSGAVKAWIGGIDFKTYKFDHANINTKRQVGSSIKPLLYADAIEDAGFTPATIVDNEAQYFDGFGLVPAGGKCELGPQVTMATALAHSLNCASASIMKQVGPKNFVDFLHNINIKSKMEAYPSLALGAIEISLYEMMWGYTMFPAGGFSTKPYYIARIEDKNGNVLARFDTERKEVISQNTAYTMCRMMQGTVDIGTAAGMRDRLGLAEMGGKTGTTQNNTDAWFIGYTPQLLAGVWIGCDDNFIRLDSKLGEGGRSARPIWEYFYAKTAADKDVGLNRKAHFVQPENMKGEMMTDYYVNIIDTTSPGAQGENEGNGKANQYLDTSSPHVPVDSKLSPDEQKILDEAIGNKKKADAIKVANPPQEKKKKGFFKRLFGGK